MASTLELPNVSIAITITINIAAAEAVDQELVYIERACRHSCRHPLLIFKFQLIRTSNRMWARTTSALSLTLLPCCMTVISNVGC